MRLSLFGLQTVGTPGDVAANLRELREAARVAKTEGGELLITPELFVTGYNIGDRVFELAQDDLLTAVREIARDEGIALLVGLPEHVAASGDGSAAPDTTDATDSTPERFYNTAVFIDETGAVLANYRKTHLYGSLDRYSFTAGDDLVCTVDYRGVKLALLICYDVEFAEVVRAAALAGAHAVLVPTAQMSPFHYVAEQVVRVRAWENQVYVAYINHDGTEHNGTVHDDTLQDGTGGDRRGGDLDYVGRSSIVDPYATVLDSLEHGTGLISAIIDTDVVERAQRVNPYLSDRRPSLY
ncbi:MAG: carbon-nitrogen hydrolase family protein [Microbacteriaceae bacterium]|nr:carbon-nitrogen hydrolase family protein [Microbacteriaceae bacterium]